VPHAARTFRIFVSSTFSDLKAERDALQRHVFPKLKELCERRGARFQAIDLRWGVSDEAALDQQTINVCLTEIDRCRRVTPRPNFIILLGDRYGWRPPPAQIPAGEFQAICARISANGRTRLEDWYLRDDNAVPAEYCLKPRERGGEYEDPDRWGAVERELRSIVLGGIEETSLEDDPRYTASATEQEIQRGATRVDDAHEHVFAFLRELKTERGLRLVDDLPPSAAASDFVDLLPEGGLDIEAWERLLGLKDALRVRLPGNVYEYEATWIEGRMSTDHIGELPETLDECLGLLDDGQAARTLCVHVWKELASAIRRQLDLLDAAAREAEREPDLLGATASEVEIHRSFGRQQANAFYGRTAVLSDVEDYLGEAETNLCVVVGELGSGKSALLAKAAERARDSYPAAAVVVRFIGATPASSDRRALLNGLCREISRAYGIEETEVPLDYRELVEEFPNRLALATAERPLIVFLDALDELSDRSLTWIPSVLPEHVRVVVSTGDELLIPLQATHPRSRFIRLEPLAERDEVDFLVSSASLDADVIEDVPSAETLDELFDNSLEAARRRLQPHQRARALDLLHRARETPLHLKTAFELAFAEARLWKSYTEPPPFGQNLRGVIRDLFARLARPERHGPLMVARTLGYLAASRHGLAEDELLEVLAADDELYAYVAGHAHHELPPTNGDRRLPAVLWSRLSLDLEPYLTERTFDGTRLLDFYHRELREVATEVYLSDGEAQERHAALAAYFRGKADPEGDGSWAGVDTHALSELPYHLTQAGSRVELFETLTDFRFLERKVAEVGVVEQIDAEGNTMNTYTGVDLLQDDFERALENLGVRPADRRRLVVTATDLGSGLMVDCPWCNLPSPLEESWRGREIECPSCGGPLRVNPFVMDRGWEGGSE
jgi:hypothetical protein